MLSQKCGVQFLVVSPVLFWGGLVGWLFSLRLKGTHLEYQTKAFSHVALAHVFLQIFSFDTDTDPPFPFLN